MITHMTCELKRLILIGVGLPDLIINRRGTSQAVIRIRENRNQVGDRSFKGNLIGTGNKNYSPTMRWIVSTLMDENQLLIFEQYVYTFELNPAVNYTLQDRWRRLPDNQASIHARQIITGTTRTYAGYSESFYSFVVKLDLKDDDYVQEQGGNLYLVNFSLAEIALPVI
jgi:hypothetical protein